MLFCKKLDFELKTYNNYFICFGLQQNSGWAKNKQAFGLTR